MGAVRRHPYTEERGEEVPVRAVLTNMLVVVEPLQQQQSTEADQQHDAVAHSLVLEEALERERRTLTWSIGSGSPFR